MEIDEIVHSILERLNMNEKLCCGVLDIPTGISNRHVHLSQADAAVLFGKDYAFNKMKDLSQPQQFACKETVTLIGAKGVIEKVRILGPCRTATQVELLLSDCRKLGIEICLRDSGNLEGTPGMTLAGPLGCVVLESGAIVARRHIHMRPEDAETFGVRDGEIVSVKCTGERGGVLEGATVRVSKQAKLEFHVDFEEANAMGLKDDSHVILADKKK